MVPIVLLGACSSGSGSDAGPDASVALPSPALAPIQACHQLALAGAHREERCQRLDPSDEAAYVAAKCPVEAYASQTNAFDAGLLAYSDSAVTCAVNFLGQLGCNFPATSPSGCSPLGWGVAAPGATCGTTYACQPGYYCQQFGAAACGTCVAASANDGPCGPLAYGATCLTGVCNGVTCTTFVGLGGQCVYGTFVCQPGLSCQELCEPPGMVGASCGADGDCQDGLACPATMGGAPNCATRGATGESCDPVACEFGLGCGVLPDGGTSCEPLMAGGPCVNGSDGGLCPEQEHCNADGGCVPLSGLGEACGVDSDCAAGLCLSGVCTLGPGGVSCQQTQDCLSMRCDLTAADPRCAPVCAD